MSRPGTALLVLALLGVIAVPPADAEGRKRGSFVARAAPLPAVDLDLYYPDKASCLQGIAGVHYVAEPFRAARAGTLAMILEGFTGDWDIYVVGVDGKILGASEQAQVLSGADPAERLSVRLRAGQRIEMLACNWLGEPEVEVRFDFIPRTTEANKRQQRASRSATERVPRRSTHEVEAAGGPVTPLWQWDPSELEIFVRDKVVWLNETGAEHHVTPYAGPWEKVDTMHLPVGGDASFLFRKPGEYLYRCDFAFAGFEHSFFVGDDCIGMCGRIVVKKRS